jgi:uncharacterized alkaline shock family protein YloU
MSSSDRPASEVSSAQAIAAAVREVPGVADLSTGRFAEVATYGAGERVRGLIVRNSPAGLDVEVHVCARYTPALVLDDLAARVREAVRHSVEGSGGRPLSQVHVVFDDVRIE